MAGISLFGHKLPHREAAVVGLTGQRGMDMVNPAVSRPARHEHDLKTLVRRDRNHPSVLMWSIGNEIDYPNDPYCHPSFTTMTGNNDANKPAAERMYNPAKPNMERLAVLAAMLADEVKQEDPTRPVTAAAAFPAGFSQGKRLFYANSQSVSSSTGCSSLEGLTFSPWKSLPALTCRSYRRARSR